MTFRGFISADIEKSERITSFSSDLRNTGASLKLVDLDNIHLTLKFLGDTREDHVPRIREVISEGARGFEPFRIELAGVGAFPSLNYIQVVWIGVRNAEGLGKIASHLEDELQKLGFRKDSRGFSPHMTIARVKGSRNVEAVKAMLGERAEERFGEQLVDRIRLKKSELTPRGPVYSVVEEVVLGG